MDGGGHPSSSSSSAPSVNPQATAADLLERRRLLTDALAASPYDAILYLRRAVVHAALAYPDLAAGDAYRALLLTDEISDESFEYHDRAVEAMAPHACMAGGSGRWGSLPDVLQQGSLSPPPPPPRAGTAAAVDGATQSDEDDTGNDDGGLATAQALAAVAAVRCYQILARSLLVCGCLRSAHTFCERGLAAAPDDKHLKATMRYIGMAARERLWRRHGGGGDSNSNDDDNDGQDAVYSPADLPDRGLARRAVYPWNTYEPDRFSAASLAFLNRELARAAPHCEVRATALPVLVDDRASAADDVLDGAVPTCQQLGLFAKTPIAAGEVVLREYSLLTANNRLKESACDACGTALPPLHAIGQPDADGRPVPAPVSCPECYDTVFCDDFCFAQAHDRYHPAVCDKDVDAIAKDPADARHADDALYVLLLARLLAMATHQESHPLDVTEVKYIWGDFLPPSSTANVDRVPRLLSDDAAVVDAAAAAAAATSWLPPAAWTLPFSFEVNIATPLHILEKMDLDVFADLALYDVWVCNTLYAKFRGTASARKSRRDGRPDVAAVHPLWCLANHDCDPNVTWEWGGRMALWAREERVGGKPGGIAAGQEILNHYCDVDLPVRLRREWASGSLGGWCMCQRCRAEAAADVKTTQADSVA